MHPTQKSQALLILGCGYVGRKLATQWLKHHHTPVYATCRNPSHAQTLKQHGITAFVCEHPQELPTSVLHSITHLVDSIPLHRPKDQPMFASQPRWLPELIPHLSCLQWAAYLSTTGVYGDAQGAWVHEHTPCHPTSPRGQERLHAEEAWLSSGLPVEIFRLAGIYGLERNILSRLHAGHYKAVRWQPPHYASRIHVDDIIASLWAAMQHPEALRILNIADDLPLPHVDYVQEVAAMIGAPKPIILTPEEGTQQLSAAALSFFSDNKRVSNQALHQALLPTLQYPSFRQGIQAII